jgi:hypothetical protein
MQVTEQNRKTALSTPAWIALFAAGIALQGVGRFFGWRDNPSLIWHEWAPLATVLVALCISLFGFSRLMGAKDNDPVRRRTSIVICALGISMIVASLILRYAMSIFLS